MFFMPSRMSANGWAQRWAGGTNGRRRHNWKRPGRWCKETGQQPAELYSLLDAERAYQQIQETRADDHENLAGIAEEVHPFRCSFQQNNK